MFYDSKTCVLLLMLGSTISRLCERQVAALQRFRNKGLVAKLESVCGYSQIA
jgi:hypothetical protein